MSMEGYFRIFIIEGILTLFFSVWRDYGGIMEGFFVVPSWSQYYQEFIQPFHGYSVHDLSKYYKSSSYHLMDRREWILFLPILSSLFMDTLYMIYLSTMSSSNYFMDTHSAGVMHGGSFITSSLFTSKRILNSVGQSTSLTKKLSRVQSSQCSSMGQCPSLSPVLFLRIFPVYLEYFSFNPLSVLSWVSVLNCSFYLFVLLFEHWLRQHSW